MNYREPKCSQPMFRMNTRQFPRCPIADPRLDKCRPTHDCGYPDHMRTIRSKGRGNPAATSVCDRT